MKLLKEFKTFSQKVSLYDEGIKIEKRKNESFINKEDITDIKVSNISRVIKIYTNEDKKPVLKFSVSSKKDFTNTVNFLEDKSNASIFEDEKGNLWQKKVKGKHIAIGFLILFLFFVLLAIVPESPESNKVADKTNKEEKQEDLSSMAYIQSKNFVEAMLLSPSTADFPFLDYSSVKLGDGETYRVSSHVDSQNGFGAIIRTEWTSFIKYKGGGKSDIRNWELQRLIMDGEVVYYQ